MNKLLAVLANRNVFIILIKAPNKQHIPIWFGKERIRNVWVFNYNFSFSDRQSKVVVSRNSETMHMVLPGAG